MAVLPRFARWDNGRDDSSSGASSNHGRSWVWSTCTSLCGDRIACASGGVLDLKRLTGASTIGQTPTRHAQGMGQASKCKCAGYMMLLTEGLHCSGFAGSHLTEVASVRRKHQAALLFSLQQTHLRAKGCHSLAELVATEVARFRSLTLIAHLKHHARGSLVRPTRLMS